MVGLCVVPGPRFGPSPARHLDSRLRRCPRDMSSVSQLVSWLGEGYDRGGESEHDEGQRCWRPARSIVDGWVTEDDTKTFDLSSHKCHCRMVRVPSYY